MENSEHIDAERTKQNIYWDCYQGYSFAGSSEERQFNFTEIERAYYFEHYGDFVDAQNERNELARHPERNRTVEDVLKNNKTCPEESVLQLGNIDHAVTADVLAKVVAEFFDEFNKRYGSHVHILDWALHMDESTPHIHERHVFDAKNQYGELCPQQEKALEELGFELPDSIKELAGAGSDFSVTLSRENVEALSDIDLMVVYGDEALLEALQKDELMSEIPAIKNGAVVLLDSTSRLAASTTPSILSIPATIDEYLDVLSEACGKINE